MAVVKNINEDGMYLASKAKQYAVLVDSRWVAEKLGKLHNTVLRDIRNLLDNGGFSEEFGLYNFVQSSYTNMQNKKQPCYAMTLKGFMALMSRYNSKESDAITEAYLTKFSDMEEYRKTFIHARKDFPQLTDIIQCIHGAEAKSYHYSNEADMVNRAALGMTAKQYKIKHGIPLEVKSIRDYLNAEEIERVDRAQAADVVLCRFYRDFKERQQKLLEYMGMRIGEDIITIENEEQED